MGTNPACFWYALLSAVLHLSTLGWRCSCFLGDNMAQKSTFWIIAEPHLSMLPQQIMYGITKRYYLYQEYWSGLLPWYLKALTPKNSDSTKMVSHYVLKGMLSQGKSATALSTYGYQLHNWEKWLKHYRSFIFYPFKLMHHRITCNTKSQPDTWPGQTETQQLWHSGSNSKDLSHFILKFI